MPWPGSPAPELTAARRVRLSRGWSLEGLASAAGVQPRTVRRVERGGALRQIRLDTLLRLAGALGVRPVDLLPALALRAPAPAYRRVVAGLGKRRPAGHRTQRPLPPPRESAPPAAELEPESRAGA